MRLKPKLTTLLTIYPNNVFHNLDDAPLPALIPTSAMKMFEANLPTELQSLVHDHALLSINGWLSPEGKLFACKFRFHNSIIKTLGFSNEAEIEQQGYIKLSNMRWLTQVRYQSMPITKEQQSVISRWFISNDLDLAVLELLQRDF